MKFGKEFPSQMVPEWHEAYLNYDLLKNQLKELLLFKQRTQPHHEPKPTGLKRNITLYRAFSGLTKMVHSLETDQADIENQVITVRSDGVEGSETVFLNASDEGGEYELVYFKKLDDEFNKVLKFYRSKVNEVMEEAGVLNKQMNALIAFRVKVEHPNGWGHSLEETRKLAVSTGGQIHMDDIDEESIRTMRQLEESTSDASENGQEIELVNSQIQEKDDQQSCIKTQSPASIDILNSVKLNTNLNTPRSTIKGFLNLPNQTDTKFSKENLKKAEEQLKKVFVEFYKKLRLLKSYSFLNILAISKIMKKYDKIASRSASKPYMKMVDNSLLGNSDEVSKLMERVEVTFIKHFSNSNRSKGMNTLRPHAKRERHRVTFSMGFLVGCTVSLFIALILIIRARKILNHEGIVVYMETMFPLYSLFWFLVLHMLLYAGNIYFWRRYRVNYSFIFGFKQGTELGYKEVLFLSFCVSLLSLAGVLANLDMEMDPMTQEYRAITELIPLGLVMLLISIMICPFNIIYRSSRFFLLTTLYHCVLAPLYKVTLPDFLLTDQLTSQVQALRCLEFYICYYGWGDYKHRKNSCGNSTVFRTFSFIIASLPFWWRFLQCQRRFWEEKDAMQGYNSMKYFLTIIAVSTTISYTLNREWRSIALASSILAVVVSTYWDIVIDWGLLQRKAKNRWLRDKLLVPHRSVYFGAIVLNVLLRIAWMQTVLNVKLFSVHRQVMVALLASLEIIRRGIWNFFRLENEHLNNVGKYRTFKSVPLPFDYDDNEEKDE